MAAESLSKALRHVWLTLESIHVPAALMGGMAMAAWKHVRATRDIDMLVGIGDNDPAELLSGLRAAAIHPKCDPPILMLDELRMIQMLYEPPETFVQIRIDLMLAESELQEKALERRVPIRLPDLDVEIAVLTCEDLILHKLLAGRMIDRADAAALLRANRPSLDLDYLSQTVKQTDTLPTFLQVWQEAFPGEAPGI